MFVYGLRQYLLQRRPLRANSIVTGYASREAAAEVLQPYPVGATVRALVDPSMPDKAFRLAEAGAGPVVFMIVGAVTRPYGGSASGCDRAARSRGRSCAGRRGLAAGGQAHARAVPLRGRLAGHGRSPARPARAVHGRDGETYRLLEFMADGEG